MANPLDFFQAAAQDPRFQSMIFAESAGGSQDEIESVTSAFLNRVRTQGLERALKGSSAVLTDSPQFQKAMTGNFNAFEKDVFNKTKAAIQGLADDPSKIRKFNFFENVEAFGNPDFATEEFEDIGRQRFFIRPEDPNSDSAEIQRALTRAGFNPGPIDGFLGKQTKNAIKAFQSANGLSVDGIVGPQTQQVLFNGK